VCARVVGWVPWLTAVYACLPDLLCFVIAHAGSLLYIRLFISCDYSCISTRMRAQNQTRRCGEIISSIRRSQAVAGSQPQTSVSTPSITSRAGIFRHENKKSDNGWAKAGSVQLGFRGAIGSAVVTARLLQVPSASVILDL
jgi:hypothetical protein